jgi:methylenetetrahydrofolate dehydrogenase (NADP+)/methenyltetrahydrofolate cyclohydrolase
MTAIVLDGKSLAGRIEQQLAVRVDRIKQGTAGVTPTLATVLVGDDAASATYVKMKGNACRRVGMESIRVALPGDTTTEQLMAEIDSLNNNSDVHGILLQDPVPAQIDVRACFDRIALEKDVDGVTSLGFGRMAMQQFAYCSATPAGVMTLLDAYDIDPAGKHAVVVGRGAILGKPMAMMLLNKNATVTIGHAESENLPDIVRQADIVVGAVGRPEFIRGDWIKDGAILIDAGYNEGGLGDIELQAVKARCYAYTPVPGGVGPMTIATLVSQTVAAAEKQHE